MFILSTERVGTTSSSSSSSSNHSLPPVQPRFTHKDAQEVKKLATLAKQGRPIYEDYMPTSPIRGDPDSDSEGEPAKKSLRRHVSESEEDDTDDKAHAEEDEVDEEEADKFRKALLKFKSDYYSANASGKKKVEHQKKKKNDDRSAAKKKQDNQRRSDDNEEEEEGKNSQKKKVKPKVVVQFKSRGSSGGGGGGGDLGARKTGLTYKARKSLQTSITQASKHLERIAAITKDA